VPESLFVALRGMTVDGHDFIDAAIEQGARAVVAETPAPVERPEDLAWIQVQNSAASLGTLADAYHGHPSETLPVLAVTGTNGKTTVTWLLDHILRETGRKPGLLGTVETRFGSTRRTASYTTPLSHELHELLAEMRDHGCSHALMEASSHGLAQERLAGAKIAVGGYTNLSRDHMDYHGTMEAYGAAKAQLFDSRCAAACFHIGDPVGVSFAEAFSGRKVTVGIDVPSADLNATEITCDLNGARCVVHRPSGITPLTLPLLGRHNVENALVAIGMANLAGVPTEDAITALATAQGAPGRLEKVDGPGVAVVVDYAHTPDALANVLSALRPLVPGRIICVFGAGGDRDRGKRPQMGQVAADGADLPVVTSDNPRSEDPDAIVRDILDGIPGGGAHHSQVDRRAAILWAIAEAREEDLVLIAGKGHEPYQEVGGVKHPFDDRLVAREALDSVYGEAGV